MSTLTRVTGKVFASEAEAQTGGIGQFGSAATGTPNPTTDVATIQALDAYKEGWGSAVVSNRNFPPLEEVNGVLKTISYQACYLLQEGIPTYDSETNYSATSIVKTFNEYGLQFYLSKHDDNKGHNPQSSPNDWDVVYFQTGYEDNITANRSITLSGAVSGSVSYQLTDSGKYALTIPTTGQSKSVSLTGAVTGSATLNTGNNSAVSIITTQNKYLFDGQWVTKYEILSSASSSGLYQADLSEYLPDDDYAYECQFNVKFYDYGDTNGRMYFETDIYQQGNTTNKDMLSVNQGNSEDRHNSNIFTMPVGTGRIVKWYCTDANTSRTFAVAGYRRIGTNQ